MGIKQFLILMHGGSLQGISQHYLEGLFSCVCIIKNRLSFFVGLMHQDGVLHRLTLLPILSYNMEVTS